MVPEGIDHLIIWPEGTSHLQCDASPSGHWVIKISCFDEAAKKETVQTMRQYFSDVPLAKPIYDLLAGYAPSTLHTYSYFMETFEGK